MTWLAHEDPELLAKAARVLGTGRPPKRDGKLLRALVRIRPPDAELQITLQPGPPTTWRACFCRLVDGELRCWPKDAASQDLDHALLLAIAGVHDTDSYFVRHR